MMTGLGVIFQLVFNLVKLTSENTFYLHLQSRKFDISDCINPGVLSEQKVSTLMQWLRITAARQQN